MIKLVTDKSNFSFNRTYLGKSAGKRLSDAFSKACTEKKTMYYVKAEKKRNPDKDYIGFYRPASYKYILIPVKSLAVAVEGLNEDQVLKVAKNLTKDIQQSEGKKKKLLAAEDIDIKYINQARTNILSHELSKSLDILPLPTVLDSNYWIGFACNELNIKPPKTEVVITERYLKTLKIYAMAFYAGRNLPVPILRATLRTLNYECPKLVEIKEQKGLVEALTATKEEVIDTKQRTTKLTTRTLEVKCQIAYPVSQYVPTTLVLGSRMQTRTDNVEENSIHFKPEIGDNVMFVLKDTLLEEVHKGSGKSKSCSVESQIKFYVPMPEAKKVDKVSDVQDLIDVAYDMAVSLNYPLVRIDFKC